MKWLDFAGDIVHIMFCVSVMAWIWNNGRK